MTSRVNALWATGVEPWQVCRDTLLGLVALYGAVRAGQVIRKKGLKKALMGVAMGALSTTSAGKAVLAAETDKTIKQLQVMVRQKTQARGALSRQRRASEAQEDEKIPCLDVSNISAAFIEAKVRALCFADLLTFLFRPLLRCVCILSYRVQMQNKDAIGETVLSAIPATGENEVALLERLKRWQDLEGTHWRDGQVSGGVYHGGDELQSFLVQVYGMFALSNPLHSDVFPFVRKMESEVVRMTCTLFHGGPTVCGTMTSGGTESILMAMKSYRDEARTRGIERAEIIVAASAHAAFDKAAHYFDMVIVSVPVDPVSMQLDPAAAAKAITPNTVVIVASAPGFPHGVVDPVTELAALAKRNNIGCHVDACLGGYLLPFAVQLGYDIPPFDFAVDGVTSISADTHKYGYAPKGASVVMYRDARLRSFQYFVAAEWSGGIYASPSMPGSRPGGLIAATWAALVRMGQEGYLACAREIMQTAKDIEAGIRATPGLKVLGHPHMSVVSFAADENTLVRGARINIYKVGESLASKKTNPDGTVRHGWNLNTLQNPSSIHICCTFMHRGRAAEFIQDIRNAVDQVADNPNMFKNGSAAIYGMAESLPDGSVVGDIARGFIDTLYDQ